MMFWFKRNTRKMEEVKEMTVGDVLGQMRIHNTNGEDKIFGMTMSELAKVSYFRNMFGPLMETPTWQHLVNKMELEAAIARRDKRASDFKAARYTAEVDHATNVEWDNKQVKRLTEAIAAWDKNDMTQEGKA